MDSLPSFQKGLVSTIIPVYNRPKMLREAVESVLTQSYRPIEIIIVDDGSTDNTLDISTSLAEKYSEVSVVAIENSGPGMAREAGRAKALGEFIQYLDSDDLLHKDKFSTQVSKLLNRQGCDVSYCRQNYCDMSGNILQEAWMRTDEKHETMFPAMLSGRLWGTPVPLYRKTLLDKCGPWLNLKNEEDWEYDCRVASKSLGLDYCEQTLVSVRTHDGNHLGQIHDSEIDKMSDRAKAHIEINRHAIEAGISHHAEEFQIFNRMVFLLCRQCAAKGLIEEAKELFNIVKNFQSSTTRQKIEIRVYLISSWLFGWQRIGNWSERLDQKR